MVCNELDELYMDHAICLAQRVRRRSVPNPWVGCVVVPEGTASRPASLPTSRPTSLPNPLPTSRDSAPSASTATSTSNSVLSPIFEGATCPPGGPHAEIVALRGALEAGQANGSTLYTTLEPCSHTGRTPPCVDAIISAGVIRVVIGMIDPDPNVNGKGISKLLEAGIEVTTRVCEGKVKEQLAPYVKHRTTGKPWVVLKLASTLDGRTAAPDGTSRWITGEAARTDAHQLRAISDAVLVGAGTVRADDPELIVRLDDENLASNPSDPYNPADPYNPTDATRRTQPLRVVLGKAPAGAKVHPALELSGDLGSVLEALGRRGVLQVLVEGGASVARDFHKAGLVDRYVFYVAPALFGGDDGRPIFAGAGAATIDDIWRGKLVSVEQLGDDLRIEVTA